MDNKNNFGEGRKDSTNKKSPWINNRYKNLINNINELENDFKRLTDTELRAKIFSYKVSIRKLKV